MDTATNVVIPDAIKYDIRYLPHTADAAQISAQYPTELSKRLRHEHTVPLSLIAEWVMNLKTNEKEVIHNIFKDFCCAAIVICEENTKLNNAKLQSIMPSHWRHWDDVIIRYRIVGIELFQPIAF